MSHISPSKLPTWKACQSLESTPCQWMLVSLASPSHPRHTCSTGIHPLYELWRSPQYYMLFPTTHFRISTHLYLSFPPRSEHPQVSVHLNPLGDLLSLLSAAPMVQLMGVFQVHDDFPLQDPSSYPRLHLPHMRNITIGESNWQYPYHLLRHMTFHESAHIYVTDSWLGRLEVQE